MNSPSADLEVRRMVAADLPRIIEIAAGLEHAPQYPGSTWRAVIDPDGAPPRLALVVVGASGVVEGFAVASLIPPQGELETIAVPRSSQRRGIARRLLQSLLSELGHAGVHGLWVEVRISNAPAIALYRSLGFRETGRRPRYYADPVEDALLMDLHWTSSENL